MHCASLIVLLTAALGPATAAARIAPVSIAIHDQPDDGYRVEGAFDVSAPVEVAWAVLTDYERLGQFIKSVKKSIVLERTPDRIVLEQDGVAKLLVFSRRAHVVLWVTEEAPRMIQFRDVCGRDFKSYEGRWELEPRAGGVHVSYSMKATLKSKNPAFLVRSGMQKSVRALLEQVRAEIIRRSRKASTPALASAIE
jgi:carbon monoxide dehydrogenase subunit G